MWLQCRKFGLCGFHSRHHGRISGNAVSIMCFSGDLSLFVRPVIKPKIFFTLRRYLNVDDKLYNGFHFNWNQNQGLNKDQPGPSSFVLYPGYQQLYPSDHSFFDESPARSEGLSNLSSSSSEGIVNKWWKQACSRFLSWHYKEHHKHLNNSESSRGKKSVWGKTYETFTEHCG